MGTPDTTHFMQGGSSPRPSNDCRDGCGSPVPQPAARDPQVSLRRDAVGAAVADRVVSQFLAAWNTDDEALRRHHLHATWNHRSHFADPWLELEGLAAMEVHVAQFRAANPGARFMVDAVDEHHCWVRFGWHLLGYNGALLLAGDSVAELDDDGRITKIVSFFERTERGFLPLDTA